MILNRPLFRQAGGPVMPPQQEMPVAPPSMPPPPPAPAPEEMVQQVEADAGMEGEQLGLEYLRTTNMALDGAENYEEMINAIRGNQAPIEQRYQELAEYVGPEDAGSTPESVLTLVQPTILMTEEGAIDSGIGELMSQVAGPQGQEMGPQMTQGLGQLMAAGQPPMPPPQNFASGGPVKHFAAAGPVQPDPIYGDSETLAALIQRGLEPARSFEEIYKEREPFYESILGSPEDRAAESKRQMMLDIASAGFNLASGRDPRTGENIAGRPFLSQVGTVLSGMPERAGERLAQRRKADQAAKLGALRSAETSQQAEASQRAAQSTSLASLASTLMGQKRGQTHERDLQISEQNFTRDINEDNQEHQLRLLNAEDRYRKENKELDAEISERFAQGRFGEALELTARRHANQKNLIDIGFNNTMSQMEQAHQNTLTVQDNKQDFLAEQNQIDRSYRQGLEKMRIASQKELQLLQQEFAADENDKDREIKEDILKLQEDQFEHRKGLDPSTEGTGFLGWGPSEAEQLRKLEVELKSRGADMQEWNSTVNNYLNLRNMRLRETAQQESRLLSLYDSLFPEQPGFQTKGFIDNLLSNPDAIRGYAMGVSMPKFEHAITLRYQSKTDASDPTKIIRPTIPSALESALRERQNNGFTIPDILLEQTYQAGGSVNQQEGMYREPVTGGMLRRPPLDDPEPYPQQPLITDLPPGMDITKGTGSAVTPFLHHFLEKTIGVAGDLAGGQDWKLDEETTQAVSAINALNQMATMRTMQSLAGRESVQLMERIASLQVPAAEFFYDDTKALSQFKTASRIMDYAVREQERLMSLGLPRKDRIQAEKELTSLRGLQAEYDNVVEVYERKLGRTDKDWNTALDQFFK